MISFNIPIALIMFDIFVIILNLWIYNCNAEKWTRDGVHLKFDAHELKKVFGVDSHHQVPAYDILILKPWRRKRSQHDKRCHKTICEYDNNNDSQNLPTKLSFDAWNETYLISIERHSNFLSNDLLTVVRHENQSSLHYGLPIARNNCHFLGKVVSHGNASVSISQCSQMHAMIVMSDHFVVIHPVPERLKNAEVDHVIFKRSAALVPNDLSEENLASLTRRRALQESQSTEFCEVTANTSTENNKLRADVNLSESIDEDAWSHLFDGRRPNLNNRDQIPAILNLELALFIDAQLWSYFVAEFGEKRAEEEIVDFSLALINNVYLLYQESTISPKVDIFIVRYEIWKTQPASLDAKVHRNGEAQIFLDSFCTYQSKLNPLDDNDAAHWDHATLLTGFDLYHSTPSVAGVAPVARMCDHLFSCSLVEGMHLGRSFVLAHEMGHNFGMVHDGVQNQCSKSCCLMSAINGAGKTTWSKCSGEELRDYVASLGKLNSPPNCLIDEVHQEKVVKNYRRNSTYPGQRFSIDQQCSFFWGRGYKSETPVGKDKAELCYMLWCSNGGSTISTAHPALEGSWCGERKWCIEGKCTNWSSESNGPKPVDGNWSAWSDGSHSKSVCSQCKVKGSISVRRETRLCDSPAPNNGGKSCSGSPIRGFVCRGPIICDALNHEHFADAVCNALRSDAERPDPELNGKSFQHPIAKCKVWCHLGGTQLVRNKGFFPDGTSCGDNKYCVSGECLDMSCNGQALVFSSNDCPGQERDAVGNWSSWSIWTTCSRTCGDAAVQERRRTCVAAPCQGNESNTRPCSGLPKCNSDYWGQWSEWGSCSVTCGLQGFITRTRSCTPGFKCSGSGDENIVCSNNLPCPIGWSTWAQWSSCSKSCDSGSRQRHRACTNGHDCDGISSEIQPCNSQPCEASTSAWSIWSPCSQTCGEALQKRTRQCGSQDGDGCRGLVSEEQKCPKQRSCPDNDSNGWTNWGLWSPCSASCGTGSQSRSRNCQEGSCNGSASETKSCLVKLCSRLPPGQWKPWGEWSQCSTTCGFQGRRSRSRQCSSINCDGTDTEYDNCTNTPCPSSSNELGSWDQWELWSECSKSCGSGQRQRIRYCYSDRCPPGNGIETQTCNTHLCAKGKWSPWTTWRFCAKRCATAILSTRSRKCLAVNAKQCIGFTREERFCKIHDANACQYFFKLKPPQALRRPEWSPWTQWSACNCDSKKRLRRRMCQIFEPRIMGFCSGQVFEEDTCSVPPSECRALNGEWSEWGQWSACSSECSPQSYRLRNRLCSNPQPSNRGSYCSGPSFERQDCSWQNGCTGLAVTGGWSNWTTWSECSPKCGGQRTRSRFCDNPPASQNGAVCSGSDFDLQQCASSAGCR